MHHRRPSGPPLAARLSGALLRAGRPVAARAGRLALAAALTTTVVALLLAIPVISGAGSGRPAVRLDSATTAASSRGPENAPTGPPVVVMGVDGRPVSAPGPGRATTTGATPPGGDPTAGSDDASGAGTPGSGEDQDGSPAGPDESPGTAPPAPPAGSPSTAPTSTGTTGSTNGSTTAGSTTAERTAPTTSDPAAAPTRTGPTATGPSTTEPTTTVPTTTEPTTTQPTTQPPAAPTTSSTPTTAGDPRATVLALVNAGRAASGCGALVPDRGLAREARRISAHGHETGAAGGAGSAVVASGGSAESAVAGWLADPEASSVLLDCGRTTVGIGTVDGWWAAVVG